jgi:hypothetical protein
VWGGSRAVSGIGLPGWCLWCWDLWCGCVEANAFQWCKLLYQQQTNCQYNAHQTNLHTQQSFLYSQENRALVHWVWSKTGWDSKKNLQRKSTLAFSRGFSNSEMRHFLCQTEFHPVLTPSFLFPERLHCCYIYIFTAPTCITTTITSNLLR